MSDFHGQILRVVYRLIFLFVAEDRSLEGVSLLHPQDKSEPARNARERYAAHYSTARLRELAPKIKGTRHGDHQTPRRVLITADCGGSDSPRTHLWLWELQRLANKTGMIFEVCHYPPRTSKWNKIEHRLFCHITRNWQGVPLETHEVVVNLIGSTTTGEGLEVHAWCDEKSYTKGRKITDEELAEVCIKRNKFHGEWNYEIHPRS